MATESLTAHVAQFITKSRYADVPPEVVGLAKKAILDTLACGLSGSVADCSELVRRYLANLGIAPGEATVIGSDLRLPPRFAALANGTATGADDFDDTWQATADRDQGVHPTSPVVATVLALAEPGGHSGEAVLEAILVGIEVCCRVFDAAHPRHITDGYHSSGTSAMLGAAAAAANLLRLDSEVTRRVLGIAATQTGTLSANHGTMTKPLHSGLAAECAVMSADLAALGYTASATILEGRWGFFQAEGGGHFDERIRGLLGNPWCFVDRGVWLKPWPTGSLTHPAFTKMQGLVMEHDLRPDQVAKIRVKTSDSIQDVIAFHRPKTALQGKFSMQFGLATMLLERKVTLGHFTDEFVARPEVQALIERVDYQTYSDAEASAENHTLVTSSVELDLNDGQTVGGRIDYGKGSLANPMSDEEVARKVRECAEFAGWPGNKAEEAIELVGKLETLQTVRPLTACLGSSH